ncbi:hypothetical protein FHG87_015280 [Trinorchestia longiramus]|nr:hypothetical protein FHG87_015280 [Trinorchestia longiramus]
MEDVVKSHIPVLDNSSKKGIVGVVQREHRAHFKTPKLLILIELTRNPFVELLHLSNYVQMARDCCNADTKCLRHFSNTLTWILLNNRLQLLVLETTQTSSTLFISKALITTPEFPEPPSYCLIPCGLFSPCSVDIGRSFGGVVPKFKLVQHK